MKYVFDLENKYCGSIQHKWLLTGTPWIDFHHDKKVIIYFGILFNYKPKYSCELIKEPEHLRQIVMRHTFKQLVIHKNGSLSSAINIPDLTHRQILVNLSKEEKRLYEIANCIDNIEIEQQNLDLQLKSLPNILKNRLMVANGTFKDFYQSVKKLYDSSFLPDIEAHRWIDGIHNLLAEIYKLVEDLSNSQVSKFHSILLDLQENLRQDNNFKAVIVTENPKIIGEWLKNFSNDLKILVTDNCKGKIKLKTQRAIESFQSGTIKFLYVLFMLVKLGLIYKWQRLYIFLILILIDQPMTK